MISLADALVETLKALDVAAVFGVSGANIEHLHDAVARRGAGRLDAILTKSEIGAAFMADGRARATGRLAVCCATSGGGMMNLAVGLAESFASQVPVLAVVGQAPDTLNGQGAFQDSSGAAGTVNAHMLFSALSRYVAILDDKSSFWTELEEALSAALTAPRGPAVLLVPRNRWERGVAVDDQDLALHIKRIVAMVQRVGMTVSPAWQTCQSAPGRAACEMLRHAQYPLVVVGPQVSWQEARELDDLLALLHIPTASTLGSLSHISQGRANYLGMVGVAGHPSLHRYMAERCDLLILVGSALEIMHRGPVESVLERLPLLTFAVDHRLLPQQIKHRHLFDFSVHDFDLILKQLLADGIDKRGSRAGYRQTWIKPELSTPPSVKRGTPESHLTLRQSEACHAIEPYLAACDHLFLDAGNCAAAAAHYLGVPAGVKSVIALGMGGMGYAIAAAIGAKMGQKENRLTTVVIAGDGAFLMTGMELHTACEARLPMLFLFFNNACHGMCVTRQELSFSGRTIASQYAPVDIAQSAKGLNANSPPWIARVTNLAALDAALADYFENHRAVTGILDLVIEAEEIPPFLPLNPHFTEVEEPFARVALQKVQSF